MEEKKINKKIAIVSVLIAIIITSIGVAFGYFIWNSTTNTDISFTVEGAVVELSDGSDITGANLMPVASYTSGGKDVVKKDIKIKLKDTVSNTVTVDFKLKVNSIDSGLNHSSFKYNLVNASGTSVKSGNFSTSKAGDSISLLTLSTTDGSLTTSLTSYTLYIYIDGASGDNPSSMMNQSFDFSFVVDGSNSSLEYMLATKKVESLDIGSDGNDGSGVYKVTHSAIPASSSATGNEIPAVTDYRYYGPNPNNYILLPDMNTTESRCMFNGNELLNLSMGEWPANFDCENEVVYKLDIGLGVNLYIPTSTFEIVAPAGSMTYNETNSECLYNGGSIGSMYYGNVDKNVCMQMSVIKLPLQGNQGALITKMNDKPHKLNVKNGLYRIIGSIYDERSKTNRLKVIKATPLTDGTTSLYSWDLDENGDNYNIWATPTNGNFSNSLTSGASIMKLLNSGAWWNGTSGTYDNYYIDKDAPETINVNFTNYKLSDKAKSNIDISRYYLGGYNNNPPLTNEMYGYERGTLRYDENRPLYWDGMVGLMYPSDYGYAAGNVCATGTELFNYFGECSNKDWLYNAGVNQWLMSLNSGESRYVLFASGEGAVSTYSSYYALAVSPVFYLTPSASITSGTGTLTDPYILG